jgi:hypothetical protein
MDRDAQIALLYTEAVYLAKRKCTYGDAVLYQLEGFYVEIFYIVYRRRIGRIHCFESTAFLEPYLVDLDVALLIDC